MVLPGRVSLEKMRSISGERQSAGAWYCGPPEGFVDFLGELNSRYPGLEDVNVQSAMGTPEKVMVEQLEWFGKEVMAKMRMAEAAD